MTTPSVLHVVASSHGGGAVHIRDLAQGMSARGWRVLVAMPSDGGPIGRSEIEAIGATYHALPIGKTCLPALVWLLRRLAGQVNILHAHGARAAFLCRLILLSAPRPRPAMVYTIHGFAAPHYSWPRRTALLAVEHSLETFTDAYIAVCHAEKRAFQMAGLGLPDKVHIVRNGIDLSRFGAQPDPSVSKQVRAHLGLNPEDRLVLTACRLFKPRDFNTLLRAARALIPNHARLRLLIAGDGPYRRAIESLIAAFGLQEHVMVLGLRRDVPDLMRASDLFVLSTRGWEGLPLTVLEAMASGLAVVASRVGGIPEAVVDGETGLVVTPGSPSALADAMAKLLADSDLAHRMGQKGAQRVRDEFGLDRMVAETLEVYRSLLVR